MAFSRFSTPSTAPPAFWRHWPLKQYLPVSSNTSPTVQAPLCRAAVAVIGLNVDPVGPAVWIARLSRGKLEAGLLSCWYTDLGTGLVKMLGSNEGLDPIA